MFELSFDEGAHSAALFFFALIDSDGFAFVARFDDVRESDGKDPINKGEKSGADKEED